MSVQSAPGCPLRRSCANGTAGTCPLPVPTAAEHARNRWAKLELLKLSAVVAATVPAEWTVAAVGLAAGEASQPRLDRTDATAEIHRGRAR